LILASKLCRAGKFLFLAALVKIDMLTYVVSYVQNYIHVSVLNCKAILLSTLSHFLTPGSQVCCELANTRFPLLRFRSALHCGYSGITDIQDGLFFVLTRARTFKKS
jgi:hypothetical protein